MYAMYIKFKNGHLHVKLKQGVWSQMTTGTYMYMYTHVYNEKNSLLEKLFTPFV